MKFQHAKLIIFWFKVAMRIMGTLTMRIFNRQDNRIYFLHATVITQFLPQQIIPEINFFIQVWLHPHTNKHITSVSENQFNSISLNLTNPAYKSSDQDSITAVHVLDNSITRSN